MALTKKRLEYLEICINSKTMSQEEGLELIEECRQAHVIPRGRLDQVLEEWAPCGCSAEFTSRGLKDPSCYGCDLRLDLPEMLKELGFTLEEDEGTTPSESRT